MKNHYCLQIIKKKYNNYGCTLVFVQGSIMLMVLKFGSKHKNLYMSLVLQSLYTNISFKAFLSFFIMIQENRKFHEKHYTFVSTW